MSKKCKLVKKNDNNIKLLSLLFVLFNLKHFNIRPVYDLKKSYQYRYFK